MRVASRLAGATAFSSLAAYDAGMQATNTCPKCHGRRIWRIEAFQYEGAEHATHTLRVLYGRALPIPPGQPRKFMQGEAEGVTMGTFDLFLCDQCGYSELYARNVTALRHAPQHGVHLLDATGAGAYR